MLYVRTYIIICTVQTYRISGNIDIDFNLAICFSVVKLKLAIILFKYRRLYFIKWLIEFNLPILILPSFAKYNVRRIFRLYGILYGNTHILL